jgi:Tfp pilus assembly protein PilN
LRPVNLIPPEERFGQSAATRTGPLVYVVISALVLVLAGVTALVLTDNQIADKKDEVARLKSEDAAAAAEAKRLVAYTQFQALHEARMQTIASLADSRFDWERVMRELALILPHDVWLTDLEASASASEGSESGASSSNSGGLRGSVPGPALELSGCAVGQEAVAGFVTALKDIEGVTRVGIESSELPELEEGAGSTGGGSSSGGESGDCRTRQFIAQFKLTVAFDAAPLPVSGSEEAAPITPTEKSEAASEEVSGESEESSEGG